MNTVVVGGMDDKSTTTRSSHTLYSSSSWKNPSTAHNDQELPYVVAPAVIVTADGKTDTGTSMATPMVTGTALLATSRNSSLASWPEAIRAMLLATSAQNVDGAALPYLPYGDHKDGAGVLNAAFMARLSATTYASPPGGNYSSRGHDMRTLNFASDFNSSTGYFNNQWQVYTSAGWTRVAIAWDGVGDRTNHMLDGDLDLEVRYASNGNLICSSASYDNSWEVCEWYGSATSVVIKVRKITATSTGTYFGLAWYSWTSPDD